MRCVVARRGLAPSTPSRPALDQVRHLGRRFPDARLREVPVVRAGELDASADPAGKTKIWLALEALQVTGSFKVRGALFAMSALKHARQVVAASAGNHGAAVSYASAVLGVPATVVVPRTTAQKKRDRIAAYGAELVVAKSDHYDDAEALAKEIAVNQEATYLSPYDDENVVLGNGASLGFEIVRALGGVPERVLAPFGGGGLASGLAWALEAETAAPSDPNDRPVWGVQSEASCAMALSLERGAAVERLETGGTTIAEGLEGGISRDGFERARSVVGGVVVVSERAIAGAMAHAVKELGLVIEGSAATALAPVMSGLPEGLRGGDVVVVLTGRNVDCERMESALAMA